MAKPSSSNSLRQPCSPPNSHSVIEEEPPMGSVEGEEEERKLYVAVPEKLKEGIELVLWVLRNTSTDKKIVILHVHRPPKLLPMMGAMVPVSKLGEEHVRIYRQQEKMMVEKSLDEYLVMCSKSMFRAEKLVVENDDVGLAIVELVASHRIKMLVMGAAADRHFSRKMTSPKSKIAITVQQNAHSLCKIWFVCKGQLICTRDEATNEYSSLSSSDQLRSKSLPQMQHEHFNQVTSPMPRSASENAVPFRRRPPMLKFSLPSLFRTPAAKSETSTDGTMSSRSSLTSSDSNWLWPTDDFNSSNRTVSRHKEDDGDSSSGMVTSQQDFHNLQLSSTFHELEGGDFLRDVYDRLEKVQTEAENFKHEAYRETIRRQKAERNAIEVAWKAKASESQHAKELKQKIELQKMLEDEIKENERLKNDRDKMFRGLQEARAREAEMVSCAAENKLLLEEFEDKLSEAKDSLEKLRAECEELKQARDIAIHEAQNLHQMTGKSSSGDQQQVKFSVFSYSELQEATKNFDHSLKIGEGGYGSVYKGFLRHTTVAIKLLNSKGMQGQAEFRQEVEVLSNVRHPHLVALIGTCPEAWALIYEYLPHGSLDDRLACKDKTDPLPWDVRIRIAAEICSALIFLQSNKPHGIVHGDLKPANILLDANFVSKLGDFGISRLLAQFNSTHTPCWNTNPKGTFVYMDPDFISSGDITLAADIYSFGIILLRLLTGKPVLGIISQVQEAVSNEKLHSILDRSAGKWPYIQAKQLVQLALKCCNVMRKNRPSLDGEVWKVLDIMVKVNERGKLRPLSSSSVSQNSTSIPSYFICPISQEVMRDPHIAEDGFTYEAEVINKWFESGHNMSPMTNRQFQHHNLIPNHSLRSSIQEWLQKNA
ncbi:U-box domain-containing protein 33 [Dendrobium catenatum]|uniref:U-box domain-containing protein 33 n=1 Tax=Dendrobium catenatum TaxID=906689 RepID=UPI0009F3EB97|nr:U-box domain-containing protein 33 [Dendrobium catenatum]